MASRPKSKPTAPPARSVLGNDPFLRGAAPSAPAPVPLADLAEPKTITIARFERKQPVTKQERAVRPRPPSAEKAKARPESKSRALTAESPARPKTAPTRVLEAIPKPKTAATRAIPGVPKPAAKPKTAATRAVPATPRPETRPRSAASARAKTLTYDESAQGNPAPAARALVKHVLVPEIEGDAPRPPPRAEAPREPERKPGALGVLGALAQARAQSLLGAVASSPTAMQFAGAALSGVTAMRALVASPTGLRTVDDFGEDPALVARTAPALDFLYDHYFRVSVQGAENLPRHGPLLAIANHAGALPLDGPLLRAALERSRPGLRARWLVEDAIFHAPFVGTWLNRLGAVRACPENAQRLLEGGAGLVVFPEGVNALTKTYRRRYQLQRFGRGGFVKLALRTGAPLVPTAIVGAEESMPVLATLSAPGLGLPVLPVTPSLLPLPTKWTLVFLPPIDLSKYGPADAQDLALVQRLTEEVRSAIHQALDRVRGERRSVFLG